MKDTQDLTSIDTALIVIILFTWILVLAYGYCEINELMDFRGDITLYRPSSAFAKGINSTRRHRARLMSYYHSRVDSRERAHRRLDLINIDRLY